MSASRYEGWLLAGRYRLQAELGRGGMGRVWRGRDELLDRPVAVKEVALDHRPQSEREALLRRTMSEARLAGRLSHPNITTVYDVVEADGRPWIVLQLVPAPTLADVLAQDGPLPPATVAGIGLQILDALAAAHAAGVVHRDVKPANILLDDDRRHAVLTDFGLATSVERPVGVTEAGIVVGTPAYIAPERARGGTPTPESDLWSLGVTLYTAVEGRSPFEQGAALATISAVLTADPEPFERAGALAPLIAALLSKDPAGRPSVAEARRRLRRVCAVAAGPGPAFGSGSASRTRVLEVAPPEPVPAAPALSASIPAAPALSASIPAAPAQAERAPAERAPAERALAVSVPSGPRTAEAVTRAPGRRRFGVRAGVTRFQPDHVRHVALVGVLVAAALAAASWHTEAPPTAAARPMAGTPPRRPSRRPPGRRRRGRAGCCRRSRRRPGGAPPTGAGRPGPRRPAPPRPRRRTARPGSSPSRPSTCRPSTCRRGSPSRTPGRGRPRAGSSRRQQARARLSDGFSPAVMT
ncbi:protein kinase [Actinomadura sp. ATCC 31491]|uniref:non-specific serine/threonine protein kinase n=1 Tax=Actinomadura luzonensis TaxID=2805427 RepID=A0ABT0FR66_9ACTN|nr:serine/threonine-protein kinase [Actinomadura luzonensis]MCK2214790.1 protein kinase [Actinomadura luzonensis]